MAMSRPLIDPTLELELSGKHDPQDPLNVFLKVALPKSASTSEARATTAANLIKRVERAIKRVEHAAAITPKFQYRDLDGVLQVKAPREFLRQLIKEPEVQSASIVPHFESALIEPVARREVDDQAIDRPIASRRRTPRGRR
jgi:hypothetical protein